MENDFIKITFCENCGVKIALLTEDAASRFDGYCTRCNLKKQNEYVNSKKRKKTGVRIYDEKE